MTIELPKTFDPAEIEARWYAHWEGAGLFRPDRPTAVPYTIVNPPPNVTGSLHIGHALDNTLQDIMIRYERLRGKDALWVVGTDHAGIATQMVVERQMADRQDKRTNYSREQFVAKVWEWKEESGGEITRQLRRLGCSMDWSNERFTMDEGFSKAVIKVFVELHKRGLLYRDKRLVNWDPFFRSAISDLEVETKEVKGGFWHFRYPLADGVRLANGADHIVVATTRPETMLADMAVAVNAADPRYADVIGKDILQPITGRRFKIVVDDHADPELGTGAVKITPGHDFNDFEVGKRAGFKAADMLNMFDADANVVQTADGLIPDRFLGLHRFRRDGVDGARELVVAEMKALGLLVPHITKDKDGEPVEADAEPRTIQTPYGDRSGVVIEPWLTDQWYVDAETLAQPAIKAVRDGAIEIVPKTWEKTWFNWLENIQPWCVSRQLWWGHRIPAWYDEDGKAYVAEDEAGAQALAGNKALTRDEDVLDTWFSSALWPFGTLGWPDALKPSPLQGRGLGEGHTSEAMEVRSSQDSPLSPTLSPEGERELRPIPGSDLARHYPNDLLISGFDILFFWDARMAMQGIEFMGQVPWRKLYLHGLVRAADGQKMSKSKGNTVDPLGLIDRFGADALRFFMAAMESQGRDIKMDEKRVEGYRNFATKLWNAARFLQSNGIGASRTVGAPPANLAVNRWIIGETIATVQAIETALTDLRFDAAADAIYHFVWDNFCDWYIELIKPVLSDTKALPLDGGGLGGGDLSPSAASSGEATPPNPPHQGEGLESAAETRAVAAWAFDQILVMLHPFMPFITEELWSSTRPASNELIISHWPQADAHSIDKDASADVDWVIRLVSAIRTARTELNVPPGARLDAVATNVGEKTRDRIGSLGPLVGRLARLNSIGSGLLPEGSVAQVVIDEATFLLPLEGVIDLDAERARLAKARDAAIKERDALAGRLGNASFVERAKPEAVEKARADHADKAAEADRLEAALARLG